MKRTARRRLSGLTLVEALIFCCLWGIVMVGSLRVIADGRVMRGRAEQRAELARIAQSELDRLRAAPSSVRQVGVEERTEAAWPAGTRTRIELQDYSDGLLLARVEVTRETLQGTPSVLIETLVAGGLP